MSFLEAPTRPQHNTLYCCVLTKDLPNILKHGLPLRWKAGRYTQFLEFSPRLELIQEQAAQLRQKHAQASSLTLMTVSATKLPLRELPNRDFYIIREEWLAKSRLLGWMEFKQEPLAA